MRKSTLFWGSILVIAGIALLLDNLGLLGGIRVWDLLWPLFLILVGIWIFLGQFFRRSYRQENAALPLNGSTRARIVLHHGAGRLNISAGAESANLLQGSFSGGIDLKSHNEGDTLVADLRLPDAIIPIWDFTAGAFDWNIQLNRSIPISFELESGANESRLDFRDTLLNELRLKSGASSTVVTLPSAARLTRVDVEAGAANVEMTVPDGVAARIRSRSGISAIIVDTVRFPRQGDIYQSADFDAAANRVEIDVRMGAGSVTIR